MLIVMKNVDTKLIDVMYIFLIYIFRPPSPSLHMDISMLPQIKGPHIDACLHACTWSISYHPPNKMKNIRRSTIALLILDLTSLIFLPSSSVQFNFLPHIPSHHMDTKHYHVIVFVFMF